MTISGATMHDAESRKLRELYRLFDAGSADDLPEYEFVPADEVPAPYHGLLVHDKHMTVTVESYHGDRVNVRVLARRHAGNDYARKILLTLAGNDRVVQFGIMRVQLDLCDPEVREAIVAARVPLGRILIEHDVLRRIEPKAYLRVLPGPAMMNWFGDAGSRPTFGRLALIHCNRQPAVELLEIVAPETTRPASTRM
jgi:chorismate-pyruvate lyase